ncbi:hypothetical protein GUITHDRAFT_104103 [Guillardia theta CCMP2712]|uniref:Uncharacterized protein n=4 Tax=Guillardia theta TaxID=55529 RepID=L1JQE4_GUITC|nr:hypothetical protein GUITHDRAFT_104103 [Guillardia theta CCMP2712]EKX50293.1 hypothetical protein GUITHDRAFT_104103 [Guillardia theta CCMP2712]|eukprot:XP_005837273.1 hypothetical protein GUITHDRAFT_104103 [Guillardia theta CCMP2712]
MQSILSSSMQVDSPPPLNPPRSSVEVSEMLSKTVLVDYEGEKDDEGRMSGNGKASLHQGLSYEGEWKQGLMHGSGSLQWKDGTTYRGPFDHAKLVGKGQLRWPGGHAYDGEMLDGYRHGKGKLVMTDANELDESAVTTYDGEWRYGKRHGHGVLSYDSDGKQRYDGEWRNNLRHGRGTMLYKSGNQYTGYWKDGYPHGRGQMIWNSNEIYTGEWEDGKQHGQGEHIWIMEGTNSINFQTFNRYVGQFEKGKRHGQGRFEYADGTVYEGGWNENHKDGFGKYLYPDGRTYAGSVAQDKLPDKKIKSTSHDFILYISDLLEDDSNPELELRKIKNLFVKHATELKQIFRSYSQIEEAKPLGSFKTTSQGSSSSIATKMTNSKEQEVENSFAMKMIDFWKFAKDCRLPDNKLNLAEIDRIFMQIDPTAGSTIGEANRKRKMIYRQFQEALVRLANFKIPHALRVSDRLAQLLTHYILPLAGRESKDDLPKKLDDPVCKVVTKAFEPRMRKRFQEESKARGRDFLYLCEVLELWLKDNVIVSSSEFPEVVRLYHSSLYDSYEQVEGNKRNLDACLTYDEYAELLFRLADHHTGYPNKINFPETLENFLLRFMPDVHVSKELKAAAFRPPPQSFSRGSFSRAPSGMSRSSSRASFSFSRVSSAGNLVAGLARRSMSIKRVPSK